MEWDDMDRMDEASGKGTACTVDRHAWADMLPSMLDHLPDAARIHLAIRPDPALDAGPVLVAMDKLFAHFLREGRCSAHGSAMVAEGAALVLAWVGGPLSGCSHDKIAGILTHHHLLDAPPIAVATGAGWTTVHRAGLRTLAAAGSLTGDFLDTQVTDLGALRRSGLRPIAGSWLARVLA